MLQVINLYCNIYIMVHIAWCTSSYWLVYYYGLWTYSNVTIALITGLLYIISVCTCSTEMLFCLGIQCIHFRGFLQIRICSLETQTIRGVNFPHNIAFVWLCSLTGTCMLNYVYGWFASKTYIHLWALLSEVCRIRYIWPVMAIAFIDVFNYV